MMIEELLQQLIERCDAGFRELGERTSRLEEQMRANTAGVEMTTAAYSAVDDSLVQHRKELECMSGRMTILTDAMLTLQSELAATREGVAKQVTHEVEKQVDGIVPFAVLAKQQQNGTEG